MILQKQQYHCRFKKYNYKTSPYTVNRPRSQITGNLEVHVQRIPHSLGKWRWTAFSKFPSPPADPGCWTSQNEASPPPPSFVAPRMTIPLTTECTPRSLPGYRDKRGKILTPGLRGHIDRKNRKHWIIPELWGLSLLVVPITMDTGMESQQKEKESSQIRFQLHWRNILVRNWAGPTVEGKHARVDEGSIRPRIYLALGKNASTSPFAVLWTRRRQTSCRTFYGNINLALQLNTGQE